MHFTSRASCAAIPTSNLTILADELTECEFATDANGNPLRIDRPGGAPGLQCSALLEVRQHEQSGAPPQGRSAESSPMSSGSILSSPASPRRKIRSPPSRACRRPPSLAPPDSYTHITLHHILEHVDFAAAGVKRERLFRIGTELATRSAAQGELRFRPAARLSPHAGYQVLRAKRTAGHARHLRHHCHASRLHQARQSRQAHPCHRPLGHLQTP